MLVAVAPLTVNAFGFAHRAGFQLLCYLIGLVALGYAGSAGALRAGDGRRIMRLLLPFLMLWLLGVLRTPWTPDRPAALMQALDRTALMVPCVILAVGLLTGAERRRVLGAGLIGMGVVAIWGLLQTFGIHPFLDREIWEPSLPNRPLGTRNLAAGYLVAWLPVAAGWFLIARGAWRAVLTGIIVLGWACLLRSASRGAWLAGLTAVLVMSPWMLLAGRRWMVAAWRAAPRGAWSLVGVLVVVTVLAAPGIAERLQAPVRVVTQQADRVATEVPEDGLDGAIGPTEPDDNQRDAAVTSPDFGSSPVQSLGDGTAASPAALTSIERRALIARGALRLIRERPLLGHGPGSFRLAFYRAKPPLMQRLEAVTGETAAHAHWDGLELATELGLLGLALAVVGVAGVLWHGRRLLGPRGDGDAGSEQDEGTTGGRLSREGLLEAGLMIGTVALVLHGLIDFDFHEVPTALIGATFLGLLVGAPEPAPDTRRTADRKTVRGGWRRVIVPVTAGILFVAIVGTTLWATAEAYHRKAFRVLQTRDLDGATQLLEHALRLVPDKVAYVVALAEIDGHRDKLALSVEERIRVLESAARHYEHAARLEPTVARRALRAANAWYAAVQVGSQAGHGVEVSWAARAARLNPYVTRAQVMLARLHREAGEWDAAAAALAAATAHPPVPGPMPEVLLEQGRLAAAQGDDERALGLYVELAERHRLIAAVDALTDLARAERRDPSRAGSTGRSRSSPESLAPGDATDGRSAVQALEALAAGRGGPAVAARLGLADLAFEAGRDDEAERWLRDADGAASSYDLDLRRGLLAYRQGRHAAAAEHYRSAATARPLEAAGYQGFGDVALASGDTASALRSYERALIREPGNEELEAFVARLREQNGSQR